MFGNLFGRKKTIRVTFLDADSSAVIGTSDQPVDSIPDTFEIDTQMTIRETEYTVVSAEPQRKKDFVDAGKLTIRLRKVQYIDPKEVLMTLPTISDSLPPIGKVPFIKESYFNMHEDDWRQCEFIAPSHNGAIENEFTQIRTIYEKHSVPLSGSSINAFKQLHVRKLENPLAERSDVLRYDDLAALLGTAGSLTFSTSSGKPYGFVTNGFSFAVGKSVFYGNVINGNVVQSLGVRNPEEAKELCEVLKQRYSLLLVDWINAQLL
jgi:hypothetical protein